ncbi:MAG: DUF86 domain-containing protein [Candidatus Bathyarchaeia archaeon]
MPSPGVKARIERFWRAIERLKTLTSKELDEFIMDEDSIDATERNLQVAIEAVIDIGEALISYMGWRTPKSYRDIGVILRERGVFDNRMLEELWRFTALRNILVHNYTHIASKDIHTLAKSVGESLIRIMNRLIEYMDEAGIDP